MNAHPFAPGAIEHHRRRQRRALLRWLGNALFFMACASGTALVAGIVYGALYK